MVHEIDRRITHAGQLRRTGLSVFREREVQHNGFAAVFRVAVVHGGEEIAEAVGDKACLFRAVDRCDLLLLHGTDNVRMRADDRVDAVFKEQILDLLL